MKREHSLGPYSVHLKIRQNGKRKLNKSRLTGASPQQFVSEQNPQIVQFNIEFQLVSF